MSISLNTHLVISSTLIKEVLLRFNKLAADAIVFVVDLKGGLLGSITDGDVRRGLLKGLTIEDEAGKFIESEPKFIRRGKYTIEEVISYREQGFKILPVIDENRKVVNIINFRNVRSYLPIDAIIMAGGKGQRLRPLTLHTPKPLLKVGNMSIIEHNINRLKLFGIDDFWISVNYLGDQIKDHLGDGNDHNIHIQYLWEDEPMGTIGAVSNIENNIHDYVLITNSDILTNLDYEDFFLSFIESGADMSVVTIPFNVNIPYAVLELEEGNVVNLKEKPTLTYHSNGGIYLVRRDILLKNIPKNQFFNATDLIELLISKDCKVHSYPWKNYWLDIGKHEDFEKAQEDIKHIKF